jgi:hypothetical protein
MQPYLPWRTLANQIGCPYLRIMKLYARVIAAIRRVCHPPQVLPGWLGQPTNLSPLAEGLFFTWLLNQTYPA